MSSLAVDIETVLTSAGHEAARRGHRYIGPEHLLLALLDVDYSVREAVNREGVELSALRARLDRIIGHADHATTYQEGLTHRSRAILRGAVWAARRQHRPVVPLDLLLAILGDEGSVACRVLRKLGVRSAGVEVSLHHQLDRRD